MEIKLEEITINDYANRLKLGLEVEFLEAVDSELNKVLGSIGNGFDLALFMLNKDLLIFRCKLAKAVFSFENTYIAIYEKKIRELQEQIEKKAVKKEKGNPYQSFLAWILAVEKYIGFAIDKNNDLLYFAEATKQMLNYYDQQKKQIDEQNSKQKRK